MMERDSQAPRKRDSSRRAFTESLVGSPKLVSSASTSDLMEECDLATVETGRREDSSENVGRGRLEGGSCEKLQEELGESNLVSSSLSTESDTTLVGLSENIEWVRRNFKRPLTLAMRDILIRKPSDPVGFLASWLLHYRSVQEKFQLREEQDRELMEERRRIQQSSSFSSSKTEEHQEIQKPAWDEEAYEGDEEIVDSNFQNFTR